MKTNLKLSITGLCTLTLKPTVHSKENPRYHGEILLVDSRNPVNITTKKTARIAVLPEHRPLLTFRLGDLQKAGRKIPGSRSINIDMSGEETISFPLGPWDHDKPTKITPIKIGWGENSRPGLLSTDRKFDKYTPNLETFNVSNIYSSKNIIAKVRLNLSGELSSGNPIKHRNRTIKWYFKEADPCADAEPLRQPEGKFTTYEISNHILLRSTYSDEPLRIKIGSILYFLLPETGNTIHISISNLPKNARLSPLTINSDTPAEHLRFYGKLAKNKKQPIHLPHATREYQFTKTGSGICPGTKKIK